MRFAPIAIVGQGCALPGALDPQTLWEAVLEGRNLLSRADAGSWGAADARFPPPPNAGGNGAPPLDKAWHDIGGYVRGFESRFDPEGFQVSADLIRRLAPLFQWVLYAGREALRSSRFQGDLGRCGAILGNLSYPTEALGDFCQHLLLEKLRDDGAPLKGARPRPDPLNRFMSGYPAHLLAQALGFGARSFCLDAACASSLYAIKLACDALQRGEADLMLAGGVNAISDLFLHVGFTSLTALSRSGRSRPFHREADGLVPALGAAVIALRRLEDAEAGGDPILGVIRGIGLSNDGAQGGFLGPAEQAQVRAMEQAYAVAGLSPSDISLLECHATGTAVGDAVEVASLSRVFSGSERTPIGSLKSNLGHLTSAAGAAGVLKVLGAIRAGVRPPTIGADDPLPQLADAPLRLLHQAEPWACEGPRRAGLSAFGFGGANAHLILEEHRPTAPTHRPPISKAITIDDDPIVIVGIGVCAADAVGSAAFAEAWLGGQSGLRKQTPEEEPSGFMTEIELDYLATGFPPSDLAETHPQQLLIMAAAAEALRGVERPAREKISVFVGMGTDTEITRHNLRLQLPSLIAGQGQSAAWMQSAKDAVSPPLTAARTIGCMPNIPANRLNLQFNFQGPSLTFSAEELSGIVALETACAALRNGEADAVLVGAVDLSAEFCHQEAARACLPEDRRTAGDAAVVLALKRRSDAVRAGDRVYAVCSGAATGTEDLKLGFGEGRINLAAQFGHAHAASGLLHAAAAALALHHQALPGQQPWMPSSEGRGASIELDALGGQRASIRLSSDRAAAPLLLRPAPTLSLFSGANRRELIRRLREDRPEPNAGEARLAIVAASPEELAKKKEQALQFLADGREFAQVALLRGIYFADKAIGGRIAFTFPSSAGAYRGMGRELLLAFPQALETFSGKLRRRESLREAARWIYDPVATSETIPAFDKLKGALFLAQIHAAISRDVLGLRPDACIGFSAGETAALFAAGAWGEIDVYYDEIAASGVWTEHLAGKWSTLEQAWADHPDVARVWRNWAVNASHEEVRRALEGEPLVHLATINAPASCSIAGQAEACERVVERLGRSRCRPLDYDLIHHCSEIIPYRDEWRRLNSRPTAPLEIRFYTGADPAASYFPDETRAADALVGMSERTVDYPQMIRNAWEDGVRVFLEHGPRSSCTSYIQQILAGREHLAVSLDSFGASDVRQLYDAVAQLFVAGVKVDHGALGSRFAAQATEQAPAASRRSYPAHRPAIRWPKPEIAAVQRMEPAPALPSALALYLTQGRPAPIVNAAARTATTPNVFAGAGEYIRRLAKMHEEFLRLQTDTHAEFLRFRQNTLHAFARASQAMGQQPAQSAAAPSPKDAAGPTGLRFDREQLLTHASGKISEIFGPLFEQQDRYAVQVRMPEPPLLLADRVTGLDAVAGSLKLGTVWTETDIRSDSWFVHQGRVLPGLMIEAGQADLFLISYLGIDFKNQGERAYRLLGCEAAYLAPLPVPGETLCFDIHIDGHAVDGRKHLFFFHYDCKVNGQTLLRVRNGQAGFFTPEELAESKGVLWSPETVSLEAMLHHAPPPIAHPRDRFGKEHLQAFAAGRIADCFGPGYEWTETHTRTPRIPGGDLLLLDEVERLDPTGGPWGRGYLRASRRIAADDWFFAGHFKNDPCMPGTLMTEMAFQGMSVYLAALGFTLDKDGWTFAPAPDETCKLACRGQATPQSKELVMEIFVRELRSEPVPTLIADILGSVDGLKALHAERLSLRLAPDFPAQSRKLSPPVFSAAPVANIGEIPCDEKQALDCAWGKPSEAFGEAFAAFDHGRRIARLPGPPYLFLSRIREIDAVYRGMQKGGRLTAEWDIPPDGVFFEKNGRRTLPFCVIQEAVLQPCGWLSVFVGCPLAADRELAFRNLDGTLELFEECLADSGTLRTKVESTSISGAGETIILSFKVEAYLNDRLILRMQTVFGYFESESLARQLGLPAAEHEPQWLATPGHLDLDLASRYCRGELRLADRMLLMLDRVTGFWPEGGEAGLGRVRGEKNVRHDDWFFKAHFFQDPVQPGSLGIEMMLQLLQFFMLHTGMDAGIENPRFEPIALHTPATWRYRGQITPNNRLVQVLLEITETGRDERRTFAKANASLWCDGLKIYQASNLGMRIV